MCTFIIPLLLIHYCTHTHTHTHVRTHTRTHMHTDAHTHNHLEVQKSTNKYTHARTHTQIHAHAHTHTHACTHAHTQIQTHARIHTQLQTRTQLQNTHMYPCSIANLHASSWSAIPSMRMPSTRNEEYRFTDISPLLKANVVVSLKRLACFGMPCFDTVSAFLQSNEKCSVAAIDHGVGFDVLLCRQ